MGERGGGLHGRGAANVRDRAGFTKGRTAGRGCHG